LGSGIFLADITEIRWHGRGGQGVKTAAEVLAEAAVRDGKFVQSFPEYGPERMGAPVLAFNRLSDQRIDLHSNVYAPKHVIVLDPTLLESTNVTDGLDKEGTLLVNTDASAEDVRSKTGFQGAIYTVDATKIAREEIGRPIANTTCLGAFVGISGITDIENVKESVRGHLGEKLGEKVIQANMRALSRAFEEVGKQ
jgi:pyruvate ferredoxin oxidoreductase gamma subunit